MSFIVDAHQHFWDRSISEFDYSWQDNEGLEKICRSFLPIDLENHIKQAGVDRTVLVQTQHNVLENRWALALAEQYDWIAGIVGWIDLASDECESQIEEFTQNPKFVGVRHVVQDEPDPDFIIRDDVGRGLALLEKYDVPYDLLFFVKHLKHAVTLARRYPNLRLVIDHLAKPEIKAAKIDGWKEDFVAAAALPNVSCKLSGMVTEASWDSWTSHHLRPYVETALESFGPGRCMFGSDWPVCELAATYQQVFDALTDCIGGVSIDERAKIFGQNACEFYQLPI